MAGERLDTATLGWHGITGDRRLAFRRIGERGGMPWLTASRLPDLLRYVPQSNQDGAPENLPAHVRTPDEVVMPVFSDELAADVARRYGSPVEMMRISNGIFDDAPISLIASHTVQEIARLSATSPNIQRFRPNVVIRLLQPVPFLEDQWLGGMLSFGEGDQAPGIAVTQHDERCSMVNLDPDSASAAPEVLKTIVRVNQNNAGVYATVTAVGNLSVGQNIFLRVAP